MKVAIKQKTEMPLLNRQEVVATVDFAGSPTPSNAQLAEEIAKQTGAKVNLVVTKQLKTNFGKNSGEMLAYVYKSEADKKTYEPMTKHIKEQIKKAEEEKKKAEEEAKAAAEEAKKKAEEEKAAAQAAKAEAEKPAEEKPAEAKADAPAPAADAAPTDAKPAE